MIQLHVPVEERLLQEAKEVGQQEDLAALIQDALAAYIRGKKVARFFDVAAETDWEPPEAKA